MQQKGSFICMFLAKRFKSERERLGFSQSAVGELLGAGKTTVINWEKGASAPDAVQLETLAKNGADPLFIITGKRSQAVAEVALLHPDERSLVESYQRCRPDAKKTLLQTAALLAAGAAPEAKVSMKAGKKSMQAGTINVKGSVQF